MGSDKYIPLFETKRARGLVLYRSFAVTLSVSICLILFYRVSYMPEDGEEGRWFWIGLLGAELWFGFYWVLTQALRWSQVHRFTFKDRLSQRCEKYLPRVDVFVCTADPTIEPPVMVINTVLSAMAYDYPPEKLAIYLSDDAGSDLTFYALLEASIFAKQWIPYCKKFNVQPRSPAAYLVSKSPPHDGGGQSQTRDFLSIKILIDSKDPCSTDIDGSALPTLVYLAREKRPQHFHNFKAGAMNALIRVSSKISNGQIILNLDCDMYSNDPLTVRDALCFFLDEEKSHDIAFVQFPQCFANVTKNDPYSSSLRVITDVEFHGTDGCGGPLYIGTGCFHRRDTLCGREFNQDSKIDWKKHDDHKRQQSVHELEAETKTLASCTYEHNTQWGNEMGLKYGCPVEDVITGLSIQCKGWKSVYLNPERKAFLGLAPSTLPQVLVQHKRWSEGDFQILLSKYSPAWYAHGRISLGLQLGYCCYCLWAPNCLATLYYSIIPSLCLLKGISLFPQVSSPWILPFAYVIFGKYINSLVEFVWADGTVLGWWNDQRMWLYKRTSSYLFATIDTILKKLGFGDTAFAITDKVADEDVSKRYEKEIMEFGATSPMFVVLSTLAMLNLFCLVGAVKKLIMNESFVRLHETMPLQILLCGVLVLVNLPLYQGLLLRKDRGRMPSSVTVKSSAVALLVCATFSFLH
ncbi:hypothetical protein SADUNF_Sadunf16G0240300 [Salix dunnii]|uniref:Cellulose synthase-like protein E1 n=1 Tax=Salix dunnii TaxID=1413687 RepID=A0A835MHD3_9ROSI|nr:hypothetical protein SADUNF_Sadunf16G0240300 [Salix dunnii]